MLLFHVILLSVVVGAYSHVIRCFVKGWDKIQEYYPDPKVNRVNVSCVIAFRNEQECLVKLIEGLKQQRGLKYEVVLVDDGSTDGSFDLAHSLTAECSNFVLLKNTGVGKKAALATGVQEAQYEYLVFTDADCIHPPHWLCSMAQFFQEHDPELLVGPVKLVDPLNKLQLFETVDFLSLVSSAAGSIGAGRPIMCNGANLAVKKHVWLKAQTQLLNGYASGDDIFLLQYCVAKDKKVRFLKNSEAIVETYPQENWRRLLKQRIRWASKTKGYTDAFTLYVASLVFLSNLLLLTIPFVFLQDWIFGVWVFGVGLVKMLCDYCLLRKGARFMGIPLGLLSYMWIAGIYPLYTVILVFKAFFSRQDWKGRAI